MTDACLAALTGSLPCLGGRLASVSTWTVPVLVLLMGLGSIETAEAADRDVVITVQAAESLTGKGRATPDGTATAVRTLSQALARARAVRASPTAAGGAIVIELQPGIYRLGEPLHLTRSDSGTPDRPLVIRAARSGAAIIRGSVPLEQTQLDPIELLRVPPASRSHVLAYRLPDAAARAPTVDLVRRHDVLPDPVPFEIFDSIGALHPARWPNAGWATGHSSTEGGRQVMVDPVREATWSRERDAWISGYFRWDWAFETQPISGFAPASGRLDLAAAPQYGLASTFRFAVHHLASELDEPGEWVRFAKKGGIAVWPRDGGGPLEVSVAVSLFEIDGAHDIRLEGLTLERVRGDAIVVRNSDDIEIIDSTIRLTGRRALTVEGGHRSGVKRCRIEDTGEGGVRLAGGDRNALAAAGHYVIDSVLARFSRLGQTYRPAVALDGVGNRIEGNSISNAPHMAISFSGNDHIIALNEITRVVTDTSDAGAIYTGRDWTAQGTVIRNNFIHDVVGHSGFDVKGVYLDDFASGITVEGNLFVGVDQPVFIGGGRDNVIRDNVFDHATPAIHIDGRGRTWAAAAIGDKGSEIYSRYAAVPTASLRWIERYPRLYSLLSDDPADPKRNAATGNVVLNGEVYRLYQEVKWADQRLEPADVVTSTRQLEGATGETVSNGGLIEHAKEMAGMLQMFSGRRASSPALPFDAMDRSTILQATTPTGQ